MPCKRFALRQRLVDLIFIPVATVDLHFIVLSPIYDTRVVRDTRVSNERVVQGQLRDYHIEMRSH